MNSKKLKHFLVYLFISALTGCPMCSDDNGGDEISQSAMVPQSSVVLNDDSQNQVSPVKTKQVSTTNAARGYSLFRISPEQVSNALKGTVGFADFRGHDPFFR